ncbi:MAG: septum formation initiator family protein [Bacteroidales bacterium]|nr:septum formation initiator family protein [Bacteroidales bacterium]
MGKLKDLWNGENRGFVRYAVVATAIVLVWILFLGDDNLVRWMKARIELRQQNRQIEMYRRDIAEMDQQIQTLSTDRDTLEEYARERFHFAEPGDDVYVERND